MRDGLLVARLAAWGVALAWLARVGEAAVGLRRIADLRRPEFDVAGSGLPTLTVIVPARNEERDVARCLESLLGQEYPGLEVIAVDDRSSDATGAIMDGLAEASGGRLRVMHVRELPARWLGKTHAMHMAAGVARGEYLLFTDADVTFRRDALRRAMGYAVTTGAAHLVVAPTTVIRRWDEAALLGFFQIFGLWGARPWRVADAAARDAIGIGAFNLVTRAAYEATGGYETLRLEIVEDLGLGRLVKRHGLAQRIAFGRGLVELHWASGVDGLVKVMTKNVFSFFRYSVPLLLFACAWLVVFCVLPFAGLFYQPLMLPALVTVACFAVGYRLISPSSGISAWNAVLAPLAAGAFIYTLLRSMWTTLRQGGVVWRGTFYPLAELRAALPPLREVLRPRRVR